MPAGLLRPLLGRLGLTQIEHVAPVRRRVATGVVARVYRQAEDDFGVLPPPIALHAGAPPVLAAAWVMLREALVVPGAVSRLDKEVLAAAVSRQNACPYCVTIHDSLARRPRAEPAARPDPQHPEVLAMTLVMHYLNRMVNVFLREVPLPPGAPRWALRPVMRVLRTDMLTAAARPSPPGASLDLLPPAALPDDLGWAEKATTAGPALARACAAIEAGGQRSLSTQTREIVLGSLSRWKGDLMGISSRWTDELVTEVPGRERALAQLALLVAFASFQVDAKVIAACREAGADDRSLLELSAWSALAAARRITSLHSFGTWDR